MTRLNFGNVLSLLLKSAEILKISAEETDADVKKCFGEANINLISTVDKLNDIHQSGYDFEILADSDGVNYIGKLIRKAIDIKPIELKKEDADNMNNLGIF